MILRELCFTSVSPLFHISNETARPLMVKNLQQFLVTVSLFYEKSFSFRVPVPFRPRSAFDRNA